MNKYYSYFCSSIGNRDAVFDDALGFFKNKPINILEIGSARNLNPYNRMSDGWSSFHFYRYIRQNGGSLTTCDIDEGAVITYNQMFEGLSAHNREIICVDGLSKIGPQYDLIYLDGGDNPADMLNQLNLIDLKTQVVLCDDFSIKGTQCKIEHPNYVLYHWEESSHEMALYKHGRSGKILLKQNQTSVTINL